MLKKMNIGQRLTFYFFTVSLISCISGFIGVIILHNSNKMYSEIITEHNEMQTPLYGIYKDMLMSRIYLRDYIIGNNDTDKHLLQTRILEFDSKFITNMLALKRLLKTQDEQIILVQLQNLFISYKDMTTELIHMSQNSSAYDNTEAEVFMRAKGTPLANQLLATIEKLIHFHHVDVDKTSLRLDVQAYRTIAFMFTFMLISFILAALITIFATKSIKGPLLKLRDAALMVANKDTTFELESNTYDEIGVISGVFNTSVKKTFHELHDSNQTIMQSLAYAQQIQNSILPVESLFKRSFSDYQIIWQPREKVSGDFFWMDTFDKGTLLFIGDCTGHGTPGAMLTMLCASILKTVVNQDNCHDLQGIITTCDQQFAGIINHTDDSNPLKIHDNLDFGIFFIEHSGRVHFASKGMRLHICNGQTVRVIKGARRSRNSPDFLDAVAVGVHIIDHDARNKFYIATDGLFDQIGSTRQLPFGYAAFTKSMLQHHTDSLAVATDNIWSNFINHMGTEPRRDDITLIAFSL